MYESTILIPIYFIVDHIDWQYTNLPYCVLFSYPLSLQSARAVGRFPSVLGVLAGFTRPEGHTEYVPTINLFYPDIFVFWD